jgi:hypothetical protein
MNLGDRDLGSFIFIMKKIDKSEQMNNKFIREKKGIHAYMWKSSKVSDWRNRIGSIFSPNLILIWSRILYYVMTASIECNRPVGFRPQHIDFRYTISNSYFTPYFNPSSSNLPYVLSYFSNNFFLIFQPPPIIPPTLINPALFLPHYIRIHYWSLTPDGSSGC